jgi:hypothetical protein
MYSVIDDAYSFLYRSNETKQNNQEEKKSSFENLQFQSSFNNNSQEQKSSLNDSYYYDYKLSSATLDTSKNELSANQSKKINLFK